MTFTVFMFCVVSFVCFALGLTVGIWIGQGIDGSGMI
jgi:hypothetical protein